MSTNRAALDRHRTALIELESQLNELRMRSLPSRRAEGDVGEACHMLAQARLALSRALRAPAADEDDPLDLPPHLQRRWGAEIIHDGGPQPAWLRNQEWVGDDDFSSIASARVWGKVRTYRLRADHPYYREAVK